MRTFAIVDANNLASRMFYGMPSLSFKGTRVEVIDGFLREIHAISHAVGVPLKRFVYCFDSADRSLRRKIVPSYKAKRDDDDFFVGTGKAKEHYRSQIDMLRKTALPAAGVKGIYWEKGYEADDLIASLCKHALCFETTRAVVVTNDSDFYQLLHPKLVRIFNHRDGSFMCYNKFRKTYEVHPDQWARVKAIAGCDVDGVKGVPGVGEMTAIKFLTEKDHSGKRMQAIHAFAQQALKNLKVVKLPLEGCPRMDKLIPSPELNFKAACKMYGINPGRLGIGYGD